jgi:regulator of replication initiation timing
MATEAATANSADTSSALSDSANLSTDIDNPSNLDFYDPADEEEKQDNETAEPSGTDDNGETGEGDEAQETADTDNANEAETDDAGESETDQPQTVKDDVIVDVQGEKLPLSELKSGYMKDRDYRIKTQELGNKRRDLEALSTRVTNSVNAIADLLVKQIPPAPDASLAMTDPGKYVADKAMHDAMMAQVTSVLEQAQAPKEAVNKLTDEQRAELLQSENAKLAEAFPQTMKPETRKKFFDDVSRVANELGYSQQDLEGVTDHRLFKLAYYANLGMAAEKAKAKAAQKVANVPPMGQQKRQAPAGKLRENQDAMRRLAKTGSMADAMAVDFE